MDRGQNRHVGHDASTGTAHPGGAGPTTLSAAWALAGVALGVTTARVLVRVAGSGTDVPGATRPEDVLLAGLAWLGALLAGWLALGSALALLALVPGGAGRVAGAVAVRLTPLAVRKSLTLVLGASVGSLALPPALVSSASTPVTTGALAGLGTAPSPGFLASPPERAEVASHPAPRRPGSSMSGPSAGSEPGQGASTVPRLSPGFTASSTDTPAPPLPQPGFRPTAPIPVTDASAGRLLSPPPRSTAAEHDLVTVRRGDSLWSVVARHLGADASDADVARAWPRWYAANRDVIGPDPDLLVPGQQLRPPGAGALSDDRPVRASSTPGGSR